MKRNYRVGGSFTKEFKQQLNSEKDAIDQTLQKSTFRAERVVPVCEGVR
jgi:hypothetical protein